MLKIFLLTFAHKISVGLPSKNSARAENFGEPSVQNFGKAYLYLYLYPYSYLYLYLYVRIELVCIVRTRFTLADPSGSGHQMIGLGDFRMRRHGCWGWASGDLDSSGLATKPSTTCKNQIIACHCGFICFYNLIYILCIHIYMLLYMFETIFGFYEFLKLLIRICIYIQIKMDELAVRERHSHQRTAHWPVWMLLAERYGI